MSRIGIMATFTLRSDGSVTISIGKWATILGDAKWRYNHLREKLELEVSSSDGLEYLRSKYPLLLRNTAKYANDHR